MPLVQLCRQSIPGQHYHLLDRLLTKVGGLENNH